MELQLTDKLRLRTAPLNWIIQRKGRSGKWSDVAYYDQFSWVKGKYPEHQKKLDGFIKKLGLEKETDLTAYHLTKKLKHPEFLNKCTPRQVEITSNLANSAAEFQRKGKKVVAG